MYDANGLGGGQFVRIGYPILTAYALATKVSRSEFVGALKAAEGPMPDNYFRNMTISERAELGVLEPGPESFY